MDKKPKAKDGKDHLDPFILLRDFFIIAALFSLFATAMLAAIDFKPVNRRLDTLLYIELATGEKNNGNHQ